MNENKMAKWLQEYDKDTLIELYSQQHFDMLAQLEEKDKEIDRLKEERHEEWLCAKEWKWKWQHIEYNQNQKAIEELEILKDFFVEEDEDGDTTVTQDIFDVVDFINERIKELKGE